MSLHAGTHVERALHNLEDGETIDEVALKRVIGSAAVVLDLTPTEAMQILDVVDLGEASGKPEASGGYMRPGDIVLLRADWSQGHVGTPKYFKETPGLTEEAARWIAGRGPKSVACDFLRGARGPAAWLDGGPFRRALAILGAGIPLIEGLVNLGELPPRVRFLAPFYESKGVESAPARAFAPIDSE